MFLIDGTTHLVTSASDLNLASSCEFAFLRTLDKRLGWIDDELPTNDDPMFRRAVTLGDSHEKRLLERFRREHGAALIELPDERSKVPEVLRERAAITADAMRAGAPVVFQGVFFDETDAELPFVGYADFLVRQPDGRYRVVDTKLSRHVKVTALLQLAAYHEQLQRLGIPADDTVELVLGDDRSETAHIDDIAPVFRKRRAHLHELIAQHRAGGVPVRWGDERYAIDGRCEFCEGPAAEADDLITVAGMRLSQRSKLIEAGIRTLADLAATPARPEGCDIPTTTFDKLQRQAALQATARGAGADDPPPFEVIDARPIAGLPEPDPGDLFFDFEGDPMYQEPGPGGAPRWGLDYLFGWVDAQGRFDCLWAHTQEDERQALVQFLDLVAERRRRHPGMHIYHYASYEKTHLLSIAARHGVGEEAVDTLLREGVLVDLYPVVKASVRVGSSSYSIKKLEPLYMGDEVRTGLASGADSVEEYVKSCEAFSRGDLAEAQRIRAEIADYNAYDCRSTLELRDWLRGLPGVGDARILVDEPEPPGTRFEPSPLDRELVDLAAAAAERGDDQAADAYRLAAAAIDFHRRETKSFWWAHFDRLEQPPEHWQDTRDVLAVEHAQVERDWHREGQQRLERRWLRLRGQWAPGSSAPRAGGKVHVIYRDPLPYLPPGHRPGRALAHRAVFHDEQPADAVVVVETRAADTPPWHALPTHLTPGPPPDAGSLAVAIDEWGRQMRDAAPAWPDGAVSSLLLRRPPAADRPLEPMRDADDGVRAVVASLTGRPRGYLAVQGPPGTGKTYLAAHAMRELVERHGWRIGVTAQSHKVVEHVLEAVVAEAGLDAALVAKAPPQGCPPGYYRGQSFTELVRDGHADYRAEHASTGYVLGGTAWDLTNRGRVDADSLDLVVVEEAGQFSLANTIAVGTSARRMLLLGDPQQLPQVSQGIHPAPVDGSALGHIAGDHAVLPAEFGYFLAASRRMHEAVAAPVSRLSYEGRLRSHPATSQRRLEGFAPGLVPVAVHHAANTTCSPEEADAVVTLVREHLGAQWTTADETRPLTEHDLIVVTPYNAQVELLRARLDEAGYPRVPVGTVDRFQGREAVVAIVSLAASSAADAPRGTDFLLSRNRLNVSISRAKWVAYLVHSPALMEGLPATAEGVATLSRFIALVEGGADREAAGEGGADREAAGEGGGDRDKAGEGGRGDTSAASEPHRDGKSATGEGDRDSTEAAGDATAAIMSG